MGTARNVQCPGTTAEGINKTYKWQKPRMNFALYMMVRGDFHATHLVHQLEHRHQLVFGCHHLVVWRVDLMSLVLSHLAAPHESSGLRQKLTETRNCRHAPPFWSSNVSNQTTQRPVPETALQRVAAFSPLPLRTRSTRYRISSKNVKWRLYPRCEHRIFNINQLPSAKSRFLSYLHVDWTFLKGSFRRESSNAQCTAAIELHGLSQDTKRRHIHQSAKTA